MTTKMDTPSMAQMLRDFPADKRQRLMTSIHEAGHAVAAVALGGRVSSAVVFDAVTNVEYQGEQTPLWGKTGHLGVRTGDLGMVAYAGPWAHAKFVAKCRGEARPTLRDIEEAICFRGCCDDTLVASAGGYREVAAITPVLQTCWDAVSRLSAKLYEDGMVNHADVCRALKLSDDGGPNSLELAMIRSGSAPGSFTT